MEDDTDPVPGNNELLFEEAMKYARRSVSEMMYVNMKCLHKTYNNAWALDLTKSFLETDGRC
jgi:hypothetical protein